MVLAGLLRVREHDPWALMTERSMAARRVTEELKDAAAKIRFGATRIKGAPQKLAITLSLVDFLETNEGRPDILTVIDQIEG